MSRGFEGVAHLAVSDERSALYTYWCSNWNNEDDNPREDGEIYIELEPIASAHVPVRTKRYPDGIPISFPENIDLGKMLGDGSLWVRNSSNCSRASVLGVDEQALTLVYEIALHIQQEGAFPAVVSYVK